MQSAIEVVGLNHALATCIKEVLGATIWRQIAVVTGVLGYLDAPLSCCGSCGDTQDKGELITGVRRIHIH